MAARNLMSSLLGQTRAVDEGRRAWTFAFCLAVALSFAFALCLALAPPLPAQDLNIWFPPDSIESMLRKREFQVLDWADTRFNGDRTQRVALRFEDSTFMLAKWAKAPRGGIGVFNNRPRYEIAAYEFQKLFLDESEYVVPPTVARCVSVDQYREMEQWAGPTFDDTRSVLVVLQYWLWNVTAKDIWDKSRFERDTVYARHFANLDLFTYLILHSDSNGGNVLISSVTSNPRLFAVDNGVAFSRRERSDRGTKWRRLRVKSLPRKTLERLRAITREDLERRLGVVAQFRLVGDQLVPETPTEPLNPKRGLRRSADIVQLGLTKGEIGQIWDRIRKVIKKVDEGKITLS
jgi:hypothetical protein